MFQPACLGVQTISGLCFQPFVHCAELLLHVCSHSNSAVMTLLSCLHLPVIPGHWEQLLDHA